MTTKKVVKVPMVTPVAGQRLDENYMEYCQRMLADKGELILPFGYKPRHYQKELFEALDEGKRRAIVVWHRRAGKDLSLWNLLIKKAMERKGTYYYFFPEFSQGRRILWRGIDGQGTGFMDYLPDVLIKRSLDQEMMVELVNGSIIQVIGTDNFDKIRGSNPIGMVFSEFAFQNPMAWEVVRPILAENGGWAVFNSTPNGTNHFYDLYAQAKTNKNWYANLLTVNDSFKDDALTIPVVTDDIIDEERESGMSEDMVQQEYFGSFTATAGGYYYMDQISALKERNAIEYLTVDPTAQIHTYWDIGFSDSTAVWFIEHTETGFRVVDYYEDNKKSLVDHVKLVAMKPYTIAEYHFPHDIDHTEITSGKTRMSLLRDVYPSLKMSKVPRGHVSDGIAMVRAILPTCTFDKINTEVGINCLNNYHREFDRTRRIYKDKPEHDWTSHGADAFRTFAMAADTPGQHRRRHSRVQSRLDRFKNVSRTGSADFMCS